MSRVYLLDGKPFPQNQILKGREVRVVEKTGICAFDALMAAELKHDKVNDFYVARFASTLTNNLFFRDIEKGISRPGWFAPSDNMA